MPAYLFGCFVVDCSTLFLFLVTDADEGKVPVCPKCSSSEVYNLGSVIPNP